MKQGPLQRTMARIRGAIRDGVDRIRAIGAERPIGAEEKTRFPSFPWEVRTLNLLFPESSPFRFLHCNCLLGQTGAFFDRPAPHGKPEEQVDLQLCLEGREATFTSKELLSASRDLRSHPDDGEIAIDERFRLAGTWPRFSMSYRSPDGDLHLEATFESEPGLHWWARLPALCQHYTSFGTCRLHWEWDGASGNIEVPGLLDHGWGGNALPLPSPLRKFRYEVLQLNDGGYVCDLHVGRPLGLSFWNGGVLRRPNDLPERLPVFAFDVHEWDRFRNADGDAVLVPTRWRGSLNGDLGAVCYEATLDTTPRPIFGNGFLCGFRYEARGSALPTEMRGEGYAEHLGHWDP